MISILKEIKEIRGTETREDKYKVHNRYTIVFQDPDRTKSAYCFSVPITNKKAQNIVDLQYRYDDKRCFFHGSNSNIIINDKIVFQNDYGKCSIFFDGEEFMRTIQTIYLRKNGALAEISPTLNGLCFKIPYSQSRLPQIILRADNNFLNIRSNRKYFCLMREEFKPLITVSCIGSFDDNGYLTSPCFLDFNKIDDKEYLLSFSAAYNGCKYIVFEVNMHEDKLVQDTTVESLNPTGNNAFGTVAYLGKTAEFGEQWLYSRIEFSFISQIYDKKILKAILHIPKHEQSNNVLISNYIDSRFCSFGSNWNNKKEIKEIISESYSLTKYYSIDITEALKGTKKKNINMAIRNKCPSSIAGISTGDSHNTPQILEIKYK